MTLKADTLEHCAWAWTQTECFQNLSPSQQDAAHTALRSFISRVGADFPLQAVTGPALTAHLIARASEIGFQETFEETTLFNLFAVWLNDHHQINVEIYSPAVTADTEAVERVNSLSPRQKQVLGGLVDGDSGTSLAAQLGMSHNTLRRHLDEIRKTLGVGTAVAVVATATRAGWRPSNRPCGTDRPEPPSHTPKRRQGRPRHQQKL